MRTRIPLGLFLCLAGVLFPSCDASSPLELPVVEDSNSTPADLIGPTWRLTALQTRKGIRYSPDQLVGRHDGDEAYTLQVKENGTLEGKADCNTYGGIYAAEDGGGVSVDSLGTTQIYCGEASQETLYLSALDAAAAYAVEGNRLRIGYGERGVLAFSRQ